MEIAIIGAGPIGCYTGHLLAENGHKVKIYENHSQIGRPIQCTGILTAEFDNLGMPTEPFLVNTIEEVEVFSPNKAKVSIRDKNYIVCRYKFDNFFADLARTSGAEIYLNHSFLGKEGKELIIFDSLSKIKKKICPEIIIGADGPLSPTAKAYEFYHSQRSNYYGIQALVEGSFDSKKIITYFGQEVCPGLFAWVAPESNALARVGIATLKNSKHYFDQFIETNKFKVKEIQAGSIPIYCHEQKLKKDNCYLVGDASGYVKATTLGGLVPALKQARILADCINTGKNYEKEVKAVKRQMKIHLHVQKILNKFKDQDWDNLISYINQPKIKKVFESYNRDNPFPLLINSIIKEPRLLSFLKYAI